jgi:hypothetical protein
MRTVLAIYTSCVTNVLLKELLPIYPAQENQMFKHKDSLAAKQEHK